MIQEKEQLIVSTIFACNKEIEKFCNETKLFETNSNIYHFNMLSLYSNIIGTNFKSLNESQLLNESYIKVPSTNNYYKYFLEVDKFLTGFHLDIQNNLNESITIDTKKVESPTNLNILTFKTELKQIIEKLSKIDDFQKYTNTDIIKTKIFAKRPLFVYGYNIINNIALQSELVNKFQLTQDKIASILYNKPEKLLYFCTKNQIFTYNIEVDEFSILNDFKFDFTENNYLQKLKEHLEIFAIYEIFVNVNFLNIKFTDNLYNDVKFAKYLEYRKTNEIVK